MYNTPFWDLLQALHWKTISDAIKLWLCFYKVNKFMNVSSMLKECGFVCQCKYRTRVKICYKNKIDYRESSGGFCRIMQSWSYSEISIEPLLHSNTSTIGTQKRLYRIIIVDVLQCKSGSFATLTGLFRYAAYCVWNLITA